MIKKLIVIFTFFSLVNAYSQELNLDKYQYIIVPDKFDFVKKVDQYQTSTLTKFLLKKKGFKVFLSSEDLPKEIRENRCKTLEALVIDESSMLAIKTIIEIKDCYGKTVYKSQVGRTKIKEYKRGFQEAIRDAYNSMEDFKFNYNPNKVEVIEDIKEEEIVEKKDVVNVEIKPKVSIKESKIQKELKSTKETKLDKVLPVLYAQPKEGGYQLINTKPEVVFIILITSKSDFYIIKNKSGTFYNGDGFWVAEFYENGELKKEKYRVKF